MSNNSRTKCRTDLHTISLLCVYMYVFVSVFYIPLPFWASPLPRVSLLVFFPQGAMAHRDSVSRSWVSPMPFLDHILGESGSQFSSSSLSDPVCHCFRLFPPPASIALTCRHTVVTTSSRKSSDLPSRTQKDLKELTRVGVVGRLCKLSGKKHMYSFFWWKKTLFIQFCQFFYSFHPVCVRVLHSL